MSQKIDYKKLEEELWNHKEPERIEPSFSVPGLSPASTGLASIRMKRWTRRLMRASITLLVLSILVWALKTHHVLRVSTQDGVVKSVELFENE